MIWVAFLLALCAVCQGVAVAIHQIPKHRGPDTQLPCHVILANTQEQLNEQILELKAITQESSEMEEKFAKLSDELKSSQPQIDQLAEAVKKTEEEERTSNKQLEALQRETNKNHEDFDKFKPAYTQKLQKELEKWKAEAETKIKALEDAFPIPASEN